MKRIIFAGLLFFILQASFSQVSLSDSIKNGSFTGFCPHAFDYSLSIGSQFTFMQGYGSGLTSYVNPHFSYSFNDRLRIGGGISISNTQYFDAKPISLNGESIPGTNGNFTSATIFVNGQYLANKRLTIYGSAFKQFPITRDPLPYNPFTPFSCKSAQGIDINMDYRIGENFHIQAGFRYSEGIQGGYNTPYQTNPFYTNPFNTGIGSYQSPYSW
ncbi:MAG: hypothetical protein M0P58_08980 [Bacteroidales bacterium]|nr:hypothetical protein [Bacteroidales bacterium]